MTMLFVEEFKKANKCPYCKDAKTPGKSVCEKHLARARLMFRLWAEKRRAVGRCVRCNRRNINGWLRCGVHTKENREKCIRWYWAHVEERAEYDRRRKAECLSRGQCPQCNRNPVAPGGTRCLECRLMHKLYRLNSENKKPRKAQRGLR
jgi:hypothetical protein